MFACSARLSRSSAAIRSAAFAACGAVVTALIVAAPVQAASAAELAGSWSGSGIVTLANGAREKAHCRANYTHAGGRTYAMSATCATAAAKVSQTAILSQNTQTRFGGTFYNPEFGVTGRIRVILTGSRQTIYLTGNAGHATFSMARR
jgi:hypothetical protein